MGTIATAVGVLPHSHPADISSWLSGVSAPLRKAWAARRLERYGGPDDAYLPQCRIRGRGHAARLSQAEEKRTRTGAR